MGVTGLWRLIEPAGKPVPVETLENKVLAVDISIWLHQMVKGYQDAKGAPLPNAHLMGLFQRLCKLLYFRIKPIFVFDGAFPDLKKETIAKRQDHKAKYHSESERLKRELALLLTKKSVVGGLLGKQISPKKYNNAPTNDDDLFKLPALPQKEEESESESEDEHDSSGSIIDLHSVDMESEKFKSLPVKKKYDLLIELKETRKMNSWGKLHELPKESTNFSDFQMQRLLKRKKVQECLEETEKEMGDSGMSLNDLECLLNEEGIDTKIDSLPTRRIASNNTTRFLLINNVRQALADAKRKRDEINNPGTSKIDEEKPAADETEAKKDELEDDLQKAIKMSMECVNEADTSACTSKTDDSWTSFVTDSDQTDSEEEDGFEQSEMSSAKAYIMQYSDYTHKAIDKMIAPKKNNKSKSKIPKIDQIIEELNTEKSVIVDKLDLSSSDDDCIENADTSKRINVHQNRSVLELNTTNEDLESLMNTTQSSVVCVENPVEDIISLDSSTEDIKEYKEAITESNLNTDKASITESDSNDDEFEEVPGEENNFVKPVVQLTLNLNEAPKDDIFADVFEDKNRVIENIEDIKSEREISVIEEIIHCHVDNINKTPDKSKNTEILKPQPEAKSKEDILIQNLLSETVNKPDVQMMEMDNNASFGKTDSTKIISVNPEAVKEQPQIHQEKIPKEVIRPPRDTISTEELNSVTDKLEDEEHGLLQEKGRLDRIGRNVTEQMTKEAQELLRPPRDPISTEELNSMADKLEDEEHSLLQEKGRLDRIGRNITEQMTKEAQDLLQLFGIPYIVAPMEAEAQCAFLETIKLTDGTITDDSDIWLFGGRTVYKNFFNQKKHVLQFLAERIERSFNLTREQLVLLALLVGSDYTTGLTGVGPVTALEILASFPFNKKQVQNETTKQAQAAKMVSGLQEFKQWVRAGKRTDNVTLKKKLKNVSVTDDFPSVRVVQAYLEPNVEKSDDKFTWGEIDITLLRDYTKAKFGWSQNKLDEIIKPVLKRILERKSQKNIHDYFKKKTDVLSLDHQVSKRVKAAIQKMGPDLSIEGQNIPMIENVLAEQTTITRKRKVSKKRNLNEILNNEAGPSKPKIKKSNVDNLLIDHGVKVISQTEDDSTGKSTIQINIPKSDRIQEIIPQREKDKHSILQNKMKAIEIFRKTKMDRKKKTTKRKVNLPREKADLSESDSN